MESSSDKVGIKQSVMEAKDYLEVAEVYTITILGMVLCSPDLAISWTEKAELPEESPVKQELHSGGGRSRGGLLKTVRPSIRNILEQISCCFWWFRTIHLKFGNVHLVLPSGKQMLLCSLIVLTYYTLRRKGTILRR
ncbi:hypothetical protein GW17_00035354 [Ensete ventricosum]|nr:hypothetical protein GW17_00035354 [Ensete ventricosum]